MVTEDELAQIQRRMAEAGITNAGAYILKAHIPVTDQFCIGRYSAACRLAENFIQLHDRDGAACDHLAQHRTRSDRR